MLIDMWFWQQAVGITLLFLLASFMTGHISYAALYLYLVVSATATGFFLSALQATLFVILFWFLSKRMAERIITALIVIFCGDALFLMVGNDYGIMNAHSFDTAVMACLLPFVLTGQITIFRTLSFLILASCILIKGGTTGIVGLGIAVILGLAIIRAWKSIAVIFAAVAYPMYLKFSTLVNPSGRLDMWTTWLTWWKTNTNIWFGAGFGAFELVGLALPVGGTTYRFMHNDFIQILFETGIVGLALLLYATAYVFSKARDIRFPLIYSLAMMTYFPTHFFLSQILLLSYLKIHEEEKHDIKRGL